MSKCDKCGIKSEYLKLYCLHVPWQKEPYVVCPICARKLIRFLAPLSVEERE